MFKVEKDVPIPESTGGGRHGKYPWGEMKVGDSFFIPQRGDGTIVRPSGPNFDDRKFTSRAVEENGQKGTRVWCVENAATDKPAVKAETKAAPASPAKSSKPKAEAKSTAAKSTKPKTPATDDLGVS